MTIEELKQVLEAATPGPWAFNFEEGDDYTTIRAGEFEVADTWFCPEMPANAHLIVEAVNNLPKLLKVAEAAKDLPYLYDQASADPYNVGYSQVSDEIEVLRKALEELGK